MIGRLGPKKPRSAFISQRLGQDTVTEELPRSKRLFQRLILVLAFAVMVLALTKEPHRGPAVADDIDTSKVADQEIRAGFYFESIDLQATKEARDVAMAKVPEYYRVDRDRVQNQIKALRARLDLVNSQRNAVAQDIFQALLASNSTQTVDEVVTKAVTAYAANLKESPEWEDLPDISALALWYMPDLNSLPQRQFAPALPKRGKDPNAETPLPVHALSPSEPQHPVFTCGDRLNDLATEGLEYILTQGVREAVLPGETSRSVVIVRDTPVADQQVSNELRWIEVPDPVQAADLLSNRLIETAKRAARDTQYPDEWAKLHEAAMAMAKPELVPTLRFDPVSTAQARERAREAVTAVPKKVEAGEIIQDRGRRWTEQSRTDVKKYLALLENEQEPGKRILGTLAAHMLFVALAMFCLFRTAKIEPGVELDDLAVRTNLALLLMGAALLTGRVVLYFEPSGFVLPVAAVGILFSILVNIRLAVMVSFLTAGLISIQYGYDWRILVIDSAMSLAGVFSIFKVRRRSDIAGASFKAMFVGLLVVAAISLATDSLFSEAAVRRLSLVGLNGFLCLLVVPGVLSPLERLFGITTDIQLLEYSDLNNEVMSQLAIKAPATYAHSLMLGQLAEAAADAIGANGLLARVCAYYHDIGKMLRSEYYTENQKGINVHDELSPRMSARAIAAHVFQGAEMARDYHLPNPIIDGILEHHGTFRIGFFYQQALEQQKHGDVQEADFRYPGPKPQRPETAILMICDAVESGVRSIKNANEERVREFVDKIIAARAGDRQFDDCHLTFKQLDTIAEVITRRIMSSLHTRLAYPEIRHGKADNVIAIGGAE